jgi:tetratricopeptide (TPR) repeat protein
MRDSKVVGVLAIIALLMLASIGSPVGSWAQVEESSPEVDEAIEDALELYEKKQYSRAAHLYAVADELSGGTSYEALMGLARSHYALGRMGATAEYAFAAMELGPPLPQRAEACMLIGHTYLDPVTFEDQVPGTEMLVPEREKNVEMAAGFFRQAMQYASVDSPDAWLHLAEAFALAGEKDAAIKLYEAYLENDPDGARTAEVKGHSPPLPLPSTSDTRVHAAVGRRPGP